MAALASEAAAAEFKAALNAESAANAEAPAAVAREQTVAVPGGFSLDGHRNGVCRQVATGLAALRERMRLYRYQAEEQWCVSDAFTRQRQLQRFHLLQGGGGARDPDGGEGVEVLG